MKKILFYILSFTWGLPLTLIGLIVAIALLVTGHKPNKYGWCYCFEVGHGWGGLELGIIFLTGKNSSDRIKNHEHGHALQNCIWGPLMLFVICIPSAIWYWYRELRYSRKGKIPPHSYDWMWFEGQATKWGKELMDNLGK